MKCPFCSAPDTQVIDSRVSEEGDVIRRRRRCTVCHKRCTTYETAELRMPQVVKTDGQREEYSRKKLETSFTRALHKRPVEQETVDAAIDRIEQGLLLGGERALKSRSIGEMVMLELKGLDQVGYIRFASVYKSFSDVEDFRDVIREVRKDAKSDAKSEGKAEGKVEAKAEAKIETKPDPKNDPKVPFSLD